jgi:hypothetical protein
MKYFLIIFVAIIGIVICSCDDEIGNSKIIKICIDYKANGWYYLLISDEQNSGHNNGHDCIAVDKNKVALIPKNWIQDSIIVNLYREGSLYNDSAYFFSLGEYQDENKHSYSYYCFYINDSLPEKEILSNEFKDEQTIIGFKLLESKIKQYNLSK